MILKFKFICLNSDVSGLQSCMVHALENCKKQTAAKYVESLFDSILNSTGCVLHKIHKWNKNWQCIVIILNNHVLYLFFPKILIHCKIYQTINLGIQAKGWRVIIINKIVIIKNHDEEHV